MPRVLITAFEPYGTWRSNASWLALVELTKQLPVTPQIVTRRYAVDFEIVRQRLADDLAGGFDVALHLGQAPGSTSLRLENIALNVRHDPYGPQVPAGTLERDGPVAYSSNLPIEHWAQSLRQKGIPCQVSHHAGIYLCNATLYWSRHISERNGWRTKSTFVHLPLETSQVVDEAEAWASLPAATVAAALRHILAAVDAAA
jgi:pyroglutamyl-peptidase